MFITKGREKAVDTGGVSRDMFSVFWECAYPKEFDGGASCISSWGRHARYGYAGDDPIPWVSFMWVFTDTSRLSCSVPHSAWSYMRDTWSGRYGIIY